MAEYLVVLYNTTPPLKDDIRLTVDLGHARELRDSLLSKLYDDGLTTRYIEDDGAYLIFAQGTYKGKLAVVRAVKD